MQMERGIAIAELLRSVDTRVCNRGGILRGWLPSSGWMSHVYIDSTLCSFLVSFLVGADSSLPASSLTVEVAQPSLMPSRAGDCPAVVRAICGYKKSPRAAVGQWGQWGKKLSASVSGPSRK